MGPPSLGATAEITISGSSDPSRSAIGLVLNDE